MREIASISLGLLFLLVFSTTTTNACTCGLDTDARSIFAKSEVVFIGKVLKIETLNEAVLVLPFGQTREGLKPNRWEKQTRKVQSITFEVSELFKGNAVNKFTVTSPRDGCFKIPFVNGRTYLVLARKMRAHTTHASDKPYLIQLKERVDRLNRDLPSYRTDGCDLTHDVESSENEYREMRNFVRKESRVTS